MVEGLKMNIYECELWISDIDEVLEFLPELDLLSEKNILITGSNGLICSAVIDVFVRWNNKHNGKINIFVAGRNEKKIKNRFKHCYSEDWFNFVSYDASSLCNVISAKCDYIIHGASNASPNKIIKEPVETMINNFIGLQYLLELAKNQKSNRVLFISSSEIYGKKEGNKPFLLNDYGYIDLLNSRNSYSVSKRAAETLCASYYDEYGVDSVIVRPGHIYGPTATESDNRVSSVWAYSVARGEDIIMKSDGSQLRSYCYCLDCASAILKVLLSGKSGNAYNISNPDSVISIKDMASLLTDFAGVELKMELPTESEKKSFNPMSNSSLDSSELLELGWKGLFSSERGFEHTVEIIRELIL